MASLPKHLPDLIQQMDQWIREGHGGKARRELEGMAEKKIPRESAAILAGLALRCQLPLLGIRWLNPIVRPSQRRPTEASPSEKVRYAACLIKIGALEEAYSLLDTIEPSQVPDGDYIRAHGLISQWHYAEAIPLLKRFIEAPTASAYEKMVAEVNLAEALIHEGNHPGALEMLSRLLRDARARRLFLVEGKVLELSAQCSISEGEFSQGDKYLEQAERLLGNSQGLDSFFVGKWKTISSYFREKGGDKSKAALHAVKEDARKRGHWETIRDCDRIEGVFEKSNELIAHLYFGSPFPAFRSRLLSELRHEFKIPDGYVWQVGKKKAGTASLDLTSPHLPKWLKAGSLTQRLLLTLSSDFYRPFRVAALHQRLYPGEFYNPLSSPSRIYMAVRRLRSYLKKARLPLEIGEVEGGYQLRARSAFAMKLPPPLLECGRTQTLLKLVRTQWPDSSFSLNDLSEALQCSRRTALNYLKDAQQEGLLRREGKGPVTRYRLAS